MTGHNVQTTQPLIGRRRDPRLRVRLWARLILLDATVRAVLADVSLGGAQIHAPDVDVRPGQQAVLVWDRFEAFGTVVWNDGQDIGLHFEEAVGRDILMATRALNDCQDVPIEEQLLRDAARAFVSGVRRV